MANLFIIDFSSRYLCLRYPVKKFSVKILNPVYQFLSFFLLTLNIILLSCQNMQNKPNLPNAKMNLNYYPRTDYKNKNLCQGQKNKPNQTQFHPQAYVITPTCAACALGIGNFTLKKCLTNFLNSVQCRFLYNELEFLYEEFCSKNW